MILHPYILLSVLLALITRPCLSSKLYVVYMGNKGIDESPDDILMQNHQILTTLHGGSVELAKSCHVYSYKHGFRGFAAELTRQQASQVADMAGVVSVFPNNKRSIHTTHSWDFMGLDSGQTTESIPVEYSNSTNNQADVIIGFIDTGIWPESPSFGDANMPPVPAGWKGQCQPGEAFNSSTCNRKVIGARYYLNGFEAEEELENNSVSFKSARDSVGHGSHTASTAAGRFVNNVNYKGLGNGKARGAAPMARIAVYKACWKTACYDADILAAFDDAIGDGVHILSLSLGADSPDVDYYNNAISVGSFHALSHGISVVASVGNDGSVGSASNLAPWMITVGASSIDRDFLSDVILGNGARFSGESLSVMKMNASAQTISASEANGGNFTPDQSRYCLESSLDTTKAKDKVLVCLSNDPTESKLAKGVAVKEAGGVGMIIIDELRTDLAIPFPIPTSVVGKRIGDEILSYLNNNTTSNRTSKIMSAKTVLGSRAAPRVQPFSSKGPNALTPGILKPDVLAPGLNILAAWSPTKENIDYNVVSGTSMACPHVTGIVALIKSMHPSWSPSAIKSAIMTTATTLDKNKKPITAGPDGRKAKPFDFGSGFVNPTQALDPGLIYEATTNDYKDFLCSIGYSNKTLQMITGDNYSTCNNRTFKTPSDLNYPSITVPNLKKSLSVSRSLTNVGVAESVYEAVVVPPIGIKVSVVPQRLVFNRVGQNIKFTVNFDVISSSKDYVFGSLSWSNKGYSLTTPLVVRTGNSKPGSCMV
ncbi:hypothetical protein ACP275_07G076100 [Erythranthe tilingii]